MPVSLFESFQIYWHFNKVAAPLKFGSIGPEKYKLQDPTGLQVLPTSLKLLIWSHLDKLILVILEHRPTAKLFARNKSVVGLSYATLKSKVKLPPGVGVGVGVAGVAVGVGVGVGGGVAI